MAKVRYHDVVNVSGKLHFALIIVVGMSKKSIVVDMYVYKQVGRHVLLFVNSTIMRRKNRYVVFYQNQNNSPKICCSSKSEFLYL